MVRSDLEVRDPCAVPRRREVLVDSQSRCVEKLRRLFELPRSGVAVDGSEGQRGGMQRTRCCQEIAIVRQGVERHDGRHAEVRNPGHRCAVPGVAVKAQREHATRYVVEDREQEPVPSARDGHERRHLRGGEDHVEIAGAREVPLEIHGQERTGCKCPSAHVPRRAEREEEPFAVQRRRRVGRLRHGGEFVAADKNLASEEACFPDDDVSLEARGRVMTPRHAQIITHSRVDRLCGVQRRLAAPFPDNARVARRGRRSGSKIGGHEDDVSRHP